MERVLPPVRARRVLAWAQRGYLDVHQGQTLLESYHAKLRDGDEAHYSFDLVQEVVVSAARLQPLQSLLVCASVVAHADLLALPISMVDGR